MTNRGGSFIGRVSGLVIQADAPVNGLRPLDVPEPPDVCVRMRGTRDQTPLGEALSAWYVSPYCDERGVPSLTILRYVQKDVPCDQAICCATQRALAFSSAGPDVTSMPGGTNRSPTLMPPTTCSAEWSRSSRGCAVVCPFTPARS